jgi:hypothetical protein
LNFLLPFLSFSRSRSPPPPLLWLVITCQSISYNVGLFGHVEVSTSDVTGRTRFRWVHKDEVRAMANDMLVPGQQNPI